jgi:hypothetical protein
LVNFPMGRLWGRPAQSAAGSKGNVCSVRPERGRERRSEVSRPVTVRHAFPPAIDRPYKQGPKTMLSHPHQAFAEGCRVVLGWMTRSCKLDDGTRRRPTKAPGTALQQPIDHIQQKTATPANSRRQRWTTQ